MRNKKGLVSEINVVPLVDIMLVLLVIFMITAPLMFNGVKLKLPKTKKVNQIKLDKSQVIVSMTLSDEYFLGETKVLFGELISEINSLLSKTSNKVVYLRADYSIKYGKVAGLISHLKKEGINEVALVTEVKKN